MRSRPARTKSVQVAPRPDQHIRAARTPRLKVPCHVRHLASERENNKRERQRQSRLRLSCDDGIRNEKELNY